MNNVYQPPMEVRAGEFRLDPLASMTRLWKWSLVFARDEYWYSDDHQGKIQGRLSSTTNRTN